MIKYQLIEDGEWTNVSSFDEIPCDALAIDCSNNKLTQLPECFNMRNMNNLQKIDCSYNELTQLPKWQNMSNLQKNYCHYNELTQLPDWLNMSNLQTITFPYHKDHLPPIESMFDELIKYANSLSSLSSQSSSLSSLSSLAMVYRSYPEDFDKSDSLSDHFTEPARMLATQGKKKSPMEMWISWSSEYKLSMSPEQQRDELYFKSGMANGFNPCIAIYAFKCLKCLNSLNSLNSHSSLSSLSILDPCMGWGDRLIAACACNATEYVGFDTNPDLIEPHKKIIAQFAVRQKISVDAQYMPFELTPSEWYDVGGRYHEKFDFVLTSPPFWTIEIYNGDQTSTTLYKTEKDWYTKFYNVLVDKSIKALKVGGYLCLYISPQMYKHTQTYLHKNSHIKYVGAIGFYQTIGKKPVDYRKIRDLFVWQKVQ